MVYFIPSNAQTSDSSYSTNLEEVIVSAYKNVSTIKTSLNIQSVKVDNLSKLGNYNLTDMLAKTPGVNMLSTGLAIAKPVIRGLYGNRIVVLLNGLKFDNQQWQEEHGLGLSDIGIGKVEIIKGPMSVLYGTEAMGGIINLIEEDKPKLNSKENEFGIKANTNTLGGTLQYGYKVNNGNKWFRLRVSAENNADYADGSNTRVLNSRFDGYQLKGTYGFIKNNWKSTNQIMSSFNRYGFIFNDIYTFIKPDARWSRSLSTNPAHLVLLNILSSENTFQLKNNAKVFFNVGIQSNKRMEKEGGGSISLNMHLFTLQYLLKWEKQYNSTTKLILSHLHSVENNTNFGARKIIPDANMQEANVSAYLEKNISSKFIIENGLGIGEKYIQTLLTPTINTPDKLIFPFKKFSPNYNLYSGFTYLPNDKLNAKLNIASGVRVPNLAELSSNGLHEGIFTFEIGDPKMKNEQNFSINTLLNYTFQNIQISVSPFYNYFLNYVYLAPTAEQWFGFPVYRYKQQNATQYGTEVTLVYSGIRNTNASISYAGMTSKLQDGNYTPFIPAQKITPNVQYKYLIKNNNPIQFFTSADFVVAQQQTAPFEKSTPNYWLLNIGANTNWVAKNKTYSIAIAGNNILNQNYYDHLSRFKNFGLNNIGRNITISLKIKNNTSTQKT